MAREELTRRPLRSRQRQWAVVAARKLAGIPVHPNHISIASMGAAALAAAALLLAAHGGPLPPAALYGAAALLIQLRLLCNLLDGMVAVEGGLGTKSGEIYNDLPDRISDAMILIAAGYSISWPSCGPALGWSAALAAIMTAYVRVLGGACGLRQEFRGPMAKPHRMAVLTAACVLSAGESALGLDHRAIAAALIVIIAGSAATAWRRMRRIVNQLEQGA
ncbi:MAG: CDP-alcohol phosphatidyltransferase family protein [Bryobacteraceae bacterium]